MEKTNKHISFLLCFHTLENIATRYPKEVLHHIYVTGSQFPLLALCLFWDSELSHVEETKFNVDEFINEGLVITFQCIPSHCDSSQIPLLKVV